MSNGDGKVARLIAPQNFEEAMAIAQKLSQSELVPKAYQGKPANMVIAWEMGAELGLSPMAAMQGIAVIGGKPVMYGELPLAVVMSSGQLEEIIEEDDGETATCIVKRKGWPKAITRTFSMEEARKAKVYERDAKTNEGRWVILADRWAWQSWPRDMRKYRARGRALKDVFADVLKGLDIGESVRDMGDLSAPQGEVIDITPPAEPENQFLPKRIDKATGEILEIQVPDFASSAVGNKADSLESPASEQTSGAAAGSRKEPTGTTPDGTPDAGSTPKRGPGRPRKVQAEEAQGLPAPVVPELKVGEEPADARKKTGAAAGVGADSGAEPGTGPAVEQDRVGAEGAAPLPEPVQEAQTPPAQAVAAAPGPVEAAMRAAGQPKRVTFTIGLGSYETAGFTKEQCRESIWLARHVDGKLGKGFTKTIASKILGVPVEAASRNDLTEPQGVELLTTMYAAMPEMAGKWTGVI